MKIKNKIAEHQKTGVKWFVIKDNKNGTFKGLVLTEHEHKHKEVKEVSNHLIKFTKLIKY